MPPASRACGERRWRLSAPAQYSQWVEMTHKATLAVVFLTLAALAGFARAQQYPTHFIKMMHGFPPGGNVDVIARIMAQEMSNGLGQPIVVESKAGAVGSVAAHMTAELLGNASHVKFL